MRTEIARAIVFEAGVQPSAVEVTVKSSQACTLWLSRRRQDPQAHGDLSALEDGQRDEQREQRDPNAHES